MGGRGSASGLGSNSSGAKDITTLSNSRLTALDRQYSQKIEELNARLAKYASERDVTQPRMPEGYYRTLRQKQNLESERRKITAEQIKRQKEQSKTNITTQKPFVNSYGEATRREITSGTYKRQQAALQKRIRRNMGY